MIGMIFSLDSFIKGCLPGSIQVKDNCYRSTSPDYNQVKFW